MLYGTVLGWTCIHALRAVAQISAVYTDLLGASLKAHAAQNTQALESFIDAVWRRVDWEAAGAHSIGKAINSMVLMPITRGAISGRLGSRIRGHQARTEPGNAAWDGDQQRYHRISTSDSPFA